MNDDEEAVGMAGKSDDLAARGAGTIDEVDGSGTAGEVGREPRRGEIGTVDVEGNESSSSSSVISSLDIIPSVDIERERLPLIGSGRALAGFLRSVVIVL